MHDRAGYRHDAVVYEGDAGFVDAMVPFVREGLAHDEPVMVAVVRPKLDLLRDALPSGERAMVRFVDMGALGHNPARILPAWLAFAAQHADAGAIRGIGEPIWAGRRAAEIAESQLHEALLNVAVDPSTPLHLVCPYDALALDDEVISQALHTHADDGHPHDTDAAHAHVMRLFSTPLPDLPPTAETLWFSADDLRPVREAVARRAAVLGEPRAHELVLAVHELATNSVVHGGGRGVVRIWQDASAFVLEIADDGRVFDPTVGRLPPDVDRAGGRGLWLAHQLCDLVQVRSSDAGTTVRISTWLEGAR